MRDFRYPCYLKLTVRGCRTDSETNFLSPNLLQVCHFCRQGLGARQFVTCTPGGGTKFWEGPNKYLTLIARLRHSTPISLSFQVFIIKVSCYLKLDQVQSKKCQKRDEFNGILLASTGLVKVVNAWSTYSLPIRITSSENMLLNVAL